jgi:hypothetical protein
MFFRTLALPAVLSTVVPLLGQSYSPLLDPVSAQTEYFTCVVEGTNPPQPDPNAPWSGETGYFTATNADFHGDDPSSPIAPYSTISPSSGTADSSGNFSFFLTTTIIGQAEWLTLSCGDNPDPADYGWAVGYGDVYYNDHPDIWIKIGGSDTGGDSGHGTTAYNRYMQLYDPNSGPAYGLYYATIEYLNNHPGVNQVCTNDMALPFGGKFDIHKDWTTPHIAHDRGTAADVAGPNSAQCPVANRVVISDFINACIDNGAVAANSIPEGNHAHCNWASPSTYPH